MNYNYFHEYTVILFDIVLCNKVYITIFLIIIMEIYNNVINRNEMSVFVFL